MYSATCAMALPIAETAQQQYAAPAQQTPRGITLPPSVLSTQPLSSVDDTSNTQPESQLDESQGKRATAFGVDEVSRATAVEQSNHWVLWIGGLVAALVAIQIAFDTLDFSFFGIDSGGRRRRRLLEEDN